MKRSIVWIAAFVIGWGWATASSVTFAGRVPEALWSASPSTPSVLMHAPIDPSAQRISAPPAPSGSSCGTAHVQHSSRYVLVGSCHPLMEAASPAP